MKFSLVPLILAFALVAIAIPDELANIVAREAEPEANANPALEVLNALEKRECHCSGKFLRKQNSFHNCAKKGGSCCSRNKDGSNGVNVRNGKGSEKCGRCYSGKCN
ncbi:hypothetical protein NEOLI_002581 [Neolecta irregularis DAH-3]|uniref:Uncharacterized protein n=1 Tax=Neolecta irregularis (strain DAH-3) TaxID=1198029 RepID=A0A1U7LUA2_NEOID|nr:hypothetical protein NEOLI_002581 [Neolecta irregularis DAH-3]|eukprot:OLL26224.1 hypothetical protein NEOLI_002581 [Neolecta irregularis DAH-3]